jgi:putative salt-induced outer membrane protein YdiY
MIHRLFLTILASTCLALQIWADRLETRQGSILYGTVVGVEDGNLTFDTEYAGQLTISTGFIKNLFSNKNIILRTDQNSTFYGQSVPGEEGKLSLRNAQESRQVSFSEIEQLWPADEEDPIILKQVAFAEAMRMKWENSLGFDLSGASGNTDNLGIGLRLDSIYSNQIRELDMYLAFVKVEQDGTTNSEETKYGAEYDSLFHESWAWYLKADFEHDPVEKLDIRFTGASGLKYDWLEEENYQISTRMGAAFRYERASKSISTASEEPALDLGLDYSHNFKEFLSLESSLSLVPILDDFEDYVFQHDTAMVLPIDLENQWQLRAGLAGTFDSTPTENLKKSDLRYYMRAVYQFK